MALTRYRQNDWFNKLFSKEFDALTFPFGTMFSPSHSFSQHFGGVDLHMTEKGYEILIDVPGFTKDEISIQEKDGYLTIYGDRKETSKEGTDESNSLIYNSRHNQIRQTVRLPRDANLDTITAKLGSTGTLVVRMERLEDSNHRRIELSYTVH